MIENSIYLINGQSVIFNHLKLFIEWNSLFIQIFPDHSNSFGTNSEVWEVRISYESVVGVLFFAAQADCFVVGGIVPSRLKSNFLAFC